VIEVSTVLNVAHLFKLSIIIFQCIPKNIDEFFLYWQNFKNSVIVEIRLLHSQPIMNNHFHFIIVELVTPQILTQWPQKIGWMIRKFSLNSCLTCRLWRCIVHCDTSFVWAAEGTLGRSQISQEWAVLEWLQMKETNLYDCW